MDADNTIETCDDVTGRTLRALFAALYEHDVHLRGTLLKPNMVIAGKGCATQAPADRIAELTVHNFKRHVPALIPGIVFLSGGQSEVQATENLERDQPARRAVAAVVLVRPRAAGVGPRGVAW